MNKKMNLIKKNVYSLLVIILALVTLSGCVVEEPNKAPTEKVTITVAGAWEDCLAIEQAASNFAIRYPNCKIVYESLQNYLSSVQKRMTGEDKIDIFFTNGIRDKNNEFYQYALNLNTQTDLDLSNTFKPLLDNAAFLKESNEEDQLYSIPVGAEVRGVYVNKTLLSKYNIKVPTNQSELLAACATLKENGYIPFHGNPTPFPQLLLFPWMANIIANSTPEDNVFLKVQDRTPGVSEEFRDVFQFLYTLVENHYYDYKVAQDSLNLFKSINDEDYVRYFLNIELQNKEYVKVDDIGQIAFMPSVYGLNSQIEKAKEDYQSGIEYEFIPAPVGLDGGYVYLSPAHSIAINKNSDNIDWGIKFFNFLFEPYNNEKFSNKFNCLPNTKETFNYISSMYDIPKDHISHLGQVTFNYDVYSIICSNLTNLSKANNPKYMLDSETYYPLQHYMDMFEESVTSK